MVKELELFTEVEKDEIQKQIDELQKELDYDTRDYPISYLVDLYEDEDETVFAPDYQRHELLWKISDKSRFIESLILDYPIPLIFLADTDDGKLVIIDGLQRISTLSQFLSDDFVLDGLKKLDKLNGCSFEDIPSGEKRRLKAKSLRIIVLKKSTPSDVRIELFDRLNTSALRANSSETRYGRESENPMMRLINELKDEEIFKKTTNLSDKRINRKEDIELISRFFAYSNDLKSYKGHVTTFLDNYIAKEGKEWSDEKEAKFKDEFLQTMNFVDEYFEKGFQKLDRNQTPRVRFEALSVGINLALREYPNLPMSKDKSETLLNSKKFEEWTTTDAANNRNKVKTRIHGVRDFLLTGKFDG